MPRQSNVCRFKQNLAALRFSRINEGADPKIGIERQKQADFQALRPEIANVQYLPTNNLRVGDHDPGTPRLKKLTLHQLFTAYLISLEVLWNRVGNSKDGNSAPPPWLHLLADRSSQPT
jgi:hypothetical protein